MKNTKLRFKPIAITIILLIQFLIIDTSHAGQQKEFSKNQIVVKLKDLNIANIRGLSAYVRRQFKAKKISSLRAPNAEFALTRVPTAAQAKSMINKINAFDSNVNKKASKGRLARVAKQKDISINNSFLITLPNNVAADKIQGKLATRKYIAEISLNYQIQEMSYPRDQFVSADGRNLIINPKTNKAYAWHLNAIEAFSGYNERGRGITIAVIDDGTVEVRNGFSSIPERLENPEFQGSDWINNGEIANTGVDNDGNGYIDDVNGVNMIEVEACRGGETAHCNSKITSTPWLSHSDYHGLAVKTFIAAKADNGIRLAGIADHAKIMGIKVITARKYERGSIYGKYQTHSTVAKAIIYATDNGADIINMSFGLNLDIFKQSERKIIDDAISYASRNGVIMVAASGNDGVEGSNTFPSANANVISVASSNIKNELSTFSNWGSIVDLAAPGENVITMPTRETSSGAFSTNRFYQESELRDPKNVYSTSGTSFASPIVAATIALMLEKNNTLSLNQIRTILKNSSSPIVGNKKGVKGGIVNIKRALAQVPALNSNTELAIRQNPRNRFDVNNDGHVQPIDALLILNAINNPALRTSPNLFLDVNGDGFVQPLDALLILNHISRN